VIPAHLSEFLENQRPHPGLPSGPELISTYVEFNTC
jgi:hypothetical protein